MQFQIYVNASFHISKSNTTNKTGLIIKIGVNKSLNNLSPITILITGKLLINVRGITSLHIVQAIFKNLLSEISPTKDSIQKVMFTKI